VRITVVVWLVLSAACGIAAARNMSIDASMAGQVKDDSAFPFDGYVPEGDFGVHDPDVIEFNGHYICFATSGNGFGSMKTSPDLIHWKDRGPIMPETPEWLRKSIPQHRSLWAPEAHRYGKGLRLYYCASMAFGHNTSWIGVAECPNFDPDKPNEGWHDLGPVIESKEGRDNFNAIDPSILIDPSGRWWMLFGSYWSGLYETELDPATGKLKSTDPSALKLVAKNPADRANGIEAPSAIYKDGYYYLFVSYGLAAQGVRSTYHTVLGRSETPDGPFVDANGKSMVDGGHESFLDSSWPMFGPGGGTATLDEKGRWLFACHYYDGRALWRDHLWGLPTLQVRQIMWSDDKWPLPGLPVTPDTEKMAGKKLASPVGTWLQQVDFGRTQTLDIKADGSCSDGRSEGKWTLQGDELQIKWPIAGEDGQFWTDDLKLSYGGNYFVGRNNGHVLIRGYKQRRR